MNYVQFLNLLLSYADKLPAALVIIQEIVASLDKLRTLFAVEPKFAGASPTPEELSLEQAVIASAQGENFAGPLDRVLEFIRNNPELIALLLRFLR